MTGAAPGNGGVWQIVVELPNGAAVADFEEALDAHATGLSSFEIPGTPGWRITAFTDGEPDRPAVTADIEVLAGNAGINMPDIVIEPVAETDWVAEVERALAPIHVGPYYVYGSHVSEPPPPETIGIRIDAGLAFGTGNHETTQGCLQAIERVCSDGGPENPLDVGTGSGILAIALAKRFGGPVTASDNDSVAVGVAGENATINGVAGLISFHAAEGLAHPALWSGAPYDLILANIVANPLIAMAADIAEAVAPAGHVILSGILGEQAESVIAAYAGRGLGLKDRIDLGEWVTLVLRAPGER